MPDMREMRADGLSAECRFSSSPSSQLHAARGTPFGESDVGPTVVIRVHHLYLWLITISFAGRAYEFLPAASDAVAVGWGTQSAALQTAADELRLLPAGRHTDMPWLGIKQLQITLGQAQTLTADEITVNSAVGVNYGPVTVSGSGKSYTIILGQPINAADRVTITIVNPGVSLFNRRLDVVPGDFNDDGVVNGQDMVGVRNEILGITSVTIFGDINGDGKLDIDDYNAVRRRIGTTLPPIT
jgi:hypothetical protein